MARAATERAKCSAREAAGRLLTLLAGDQPGYQALTRALDDADKHAFEAHLLSATWSEAWRTHLLYAAQDAF